MSRPAAQPAASPLYWVGEGGRARACFTAARMRIARDRTGGAGGLSVRARYGQVLAGRQAAQRACLGLQPRREGFKALVRARFAVLVHGAHSLAQQWESGGRRRPGGSP